MKRLIFIACVLSCLPALSSPAGGGLVDARMAALEEKVYSLEIRTQNLDNALLDQSIQLCAIRKQLQEQSGKH